MLDGLDAGTCLLEYGLPGGRYLAIERTLDTTGGGELDPFSVSYRVGNGEVLYRGTCNVVATDRALALDCISWAPGNGEHAAGKGWQDGVSFGDGRAGSAIGALSDGVSGDILVGDVFASSFNWDPYSHYDYCYYMADENGEVLNVLYCGYNDDGGGCETQAAVITQLGPVDRKGHDGSGSGSRSDVAMDPEATAGACLDPDGGGGSGTNSTDVEGTIEEEACPNCEPLTTDQLDFMTATATLDLICPDARIEVARSLTALEWAARPTNYSVRGNHWRKFHDGLTLIHYSIDKLHPGFTNASLSELDRREEVAGLMAHEAFHHMHPDAEESTIDNLTGSCVPGYEGY